MTGARRLRVSVAAVAVVAVLVCGLDAEAGAAASSRWSGPTTAFRGESLGGARVVLSGGRAVAGWDFVRKGGRYWDVQFGHQRRPGGSLRLLGTFPRADDAPAPLMVGGLSPVAVWQRRTRPGAAESSASASLGRRPVRIDRRAVPCFATDLERGRRSKAIYLVSVCERAAWLRRRVAGGFVVVGRFAAGEIDRASAAADAHGRVLLVWTRMVPRPVPDGLSTRGLGLLETRTWTPERGFGPVRVLERAPLSYEDGPGLFTRFSAAAAGSSAAGRAAIGWVDSRGRVRVASGSTVRGVGAGASVASSQDNDGTLTGTAINVSASGRAVLAWTVPRAAEDDLKAVEVGPRDRRARVLTVARGVVEYRLAGNDRGQVIVAWYTGRAGCRARIRRSSGRWEPIRRIGSRRPVAGTPTDADADIDEHGRAAAVCSQHLSASRNLVNVYLSNARIAL